MASTSIRAHSSLGTQLRQPSVSHALGKALAVFEVLVALRVALQPNVTHPPEGQHSHDQADPYPNQL